MVTLAFQATSLTTTNVMKNIVLNPAVGAILMSFSTVVVALNAQLLHRARL